MGLIEKLAKERLLATKKAVVVNNDVVVNKPTQMVVNKVVNDRSKDRHKKTEARRIYMRDYMRKKREAQKEG